jgi:type IV secretion system protein VirB6
MWVAASLVRDWQAALREKPANDMPMNSMASQSTQAAIWQSANPAMRGMTAPTGDAYARTDPMVTAISRSADVAAGMAGGSAGRTESLGLYDPQARQTSGDRFSRVQGLGQRFRNPPAIPNLNTPAVPKGTD